MTWQQLHNAAAADNLRLHRSKHGGVSIITDRTIESVLLTITSDDLPDDDRDKLVRALVERALHVLRELNA
jgi:hypothetical protein